MSKLSLFKKLIITTVAIATLTVAAIPAISASEPRDNNSNSIIYGGAYSVQELKGLLSTGVNRDNCKASYSCPYQTADDLKLLYGRLGMGPEYWDNLTNGTVFKDGHVEANGKTVAWNVQSMGRHNMPGSVREPLITYTNVYWRPTSVSFRSNSIPAFVKLNYDGTMAFAIIKSCGNPVKGVGVKKVPTHSLTIRKFEDKNGNAKKDTNEAFLPGWKFSVNGNGINKVVTTGNDGSITLTGLSDGLYSIKELTVNGWTCTTGIDRGGLINGKDGEVWFGNKRKPVTPSATFSIIAKKFEDDDSDGVRDGDEPFLSGWTIKLANSNNSLNREFQTDADGEVTFTNLPAGTYTVSEVMQTGWKNITPISRTVVLPSTNGMDPVVEFGNKKIIPVTPKGEIENVPVVPVVPLASAGPTEAIAGAFGLVSLGGSGAYYFKGKKSLLAALKKLK